MTVKLSGKLPDADRSGLDLLVGDLVRHPETRHVVIAVIDCARTTVDHGGDGDTYTPTAGGRIRAERVDGGTLDFDFGVSDGASLLKTGTGVVA